MRKKIERETVRVARLLYVVGRTSTMVRGSDPRTWMLVRTDEAAAREAAIDAARCARLEAWSARGEAPSMEAVRAAMGAEGVMLRGEGELVMLPVSLGAQWDAVERDGRETAYEQHLRGVVRAALSLRGREKRAFRHVERELEEAHGVWDAARGIGVVLRHAPLRFGEPEKVRRESRLERGIAAEIVAMPHTAITNGR